MGRYVLCHVLAGVNCKITYSQPSSHMSGFPNTNHNINNPNHLVIDSGHINTKTIQSGKSCIFKM